MSLAATLAAGGMRPASFLPSIKCSSCGDEIEISAMGDHVCGKAPETPESPRAAPASLSNPFTLRAMNASGSRPAQPSPLQFDTPPESRARAPTVGSIQVPPQRAPRPAPPRINADVANTPFLAPMPRQETPISPATSTRSGSSFGGKPQPPLRSMTSPMPRLWDPRPPSPELSANLDCAFPPWPFSDPSESRPSTSSGRRTPAGSERGSSRASSRQGSKFPDMSNIDFKVPMSSAGENVMNRMNTLKSGPFDPTRRRPSNDDRRQQESEPLDRRRPSLPEGPPPEESRPLPSVPGPDMAQLFQPTMLESVSYDASKVSISAANPTTNNKAPPERPARPTESLTPSILDKLSSGPIISIPEALSTAPPPVPLRTSDRSKTFPAPTESKDEPAAFPPLSKMPSEPALRSKERRPTLTSAPSAPVPVATLPQRGQSRNETRVDYRLQDAPPVPKPVQLHRSNSLHRPSGSDSSSVSSLNSLPNTNSSSGPSPVTSTTSSMDAYSPLAQESGQDGEDQRMRVAGLSFKNRVKPGMRAEQPKERSRSPPRDFSRPSPPKEIVLPVMESPVIPSSSNWPLESPMDPAMQNGKIGPTPEPSVTSSFSTSTPTPKAVDYDSSLDLNLSPDTFSSDEYDPYRSASPLQVPLHTRARSKTNTEPQFKPFEPPALLRSQTTQPTVPKHSALDPPRSQTAPPRPARPPPIPQHAPRPQLTRRTTTSGKTNCRGCGQQIEGKSVKAADGRLTGRWHKACFVCKTCEQPFTTADFYVHKNNPYCEQHYHEKNGSMCHGCHKGIEGQYTETSSSGPAGRVERKYHPRCFTCFNCRMVLAEDYFEIGGRVFCERHALAAMRAQPKVVGPGGSLGPPGKPGRPSIPTPHGSSNLRAERRTTKLMMMS